MENNMDDDLYNVESIDDAVEIFKLDSISDVVDVLNLCYSNFKKNIKNLKKGKPGTIYIGFIDRMFELCGDYLKYSNKSEFRREVREGAIAAKRNRSRNAPILKEEYFLELKPVYEPPVELELTFEESPIVSMENSYKEIVPKFEMFLGSWGHHHG
jgi:hypothetical protein